MIVNVAYKFTGQFRPRRAREWKPRDYLGLASFCIREIATDEAVIAFWWTPPRAAASHQVAVFAAENELWHPVELSFELREDFGPEGAPDTSKAFRPSNRATEDQSMSKTPRFAGPQDLSRTLAVESISAINSHDRFLRRGVVGSAVRPGDDEDAADRDLSGSREAEVLLAVELSRLRVIDGIVCRRIQAPVIRLLLSHPQPCLEFDYAANQMGDHFPIDRFDEAAAQLFAIGAGANINVDPPEILRPDLLGAGHPLEADALVVIASIVDEQLRDPSSSTEISGEPLATITAWIRLRDAWRDKQPIEVLLDKLQDLVESPHDGKLPYIKDASNLIARRALNSGDEELIGLGAGV